MSELVFILLPGTMYFWVLFVGQGPMQEVLEEAESRILPRILACPVQPWQYILAKMLRAFLLCSAAVVLLLTTSGVLFGVHWGNAISLAAVVLAWATSMTGLVALIFALVRTREQASVFAPMVLMTTGLLGGSMFPYENMPAFLQLVGQFTPNRWAVLALQGVARSKSLLELAAPLTGLLVLGILGSGLAFALFNRRLSGGSSRP